MGVEAKESPISDDEFDQMREFVYEYLNASVQNEDDGGRMRWYPWHSAEYRYNHIINVVSLAKRIAEAEGANVDVTRVAAVFHDVAKLDADQEVHATEGARVAREYLESRGKFPRTFVEQVCKAIETHTHQGDLNAVTPETRSLIEADILDKIGANGTTLMLLRMGYEARTHMEAATMIERILKRGEDAAARIVSPTAQSIAYERLKRVRWFREWLELEVPRMEPDNI